MCPMVWAERLIWPPDDLGGAADRPPDDLGGAADKPPDDLGGAADRPPDGLAGAAAMIWAERLFLSSSLGAATSLEAVNTEVQDAAR